MLEKLLKSTDFQKLDKSQQKSINGGYCPIVSNVTAANCTRIVRRCGGSGFGEGHNVITFQCGNGTVFTTTEYEI